MLDFCVGLDTEFSEIVEGSHLYYPKTKFEQVCGAGSCTLVSVPDPHTGLVPRLSICQHLMVVARITKLAQEEHTSLAC